MQFIVSLFDFPKHERKYKKATKNEMSQMIKQLLNSVNCVIIAYYWI
jgi:quinolinate synthase